MSESILRIIVTILAFISIGVAWSYGKVAYRRKKYVKLVIIIIVWFIAFAVLATIRGAHLR